jgi:hypothetical protein
MSEFTHTRGRYLRPRASHWLLHNLVLWSCLFLAFVRGGLCASRVNGPQHPPSALAGPGLQFAIADFDGDHRPDLATLQTCQDCSAVGSYWIQLQLSAAGPQSIHIFGPPGGLVVEARDVNGDHAVDLVLFTTWFRQPVAVLLNDGHGRFTAATPAAFPEAFQQSLRTSFYSQQHLPGPIGALTQSRLGVCTETPLSHSLSATRFRSPFTSAIFLPSYVLSNRGRDPPIRS